MGISLYDLGVKSYLQIIPAVSGFLEKGRSHFEENQRNLDDIVNSSIRRHGAIYLSTIQRRAPFARCD